MKRGFVLRNRTSVSGPTSPVIDYFAMEAHIDLYNLILCFSLFV